MVKLLILNKTCTKCGRELPATEDYFYVDKRSKRGLTTACKSCIGISVKNWRSNNKDKVSQYMKEYNKSYKKKYHSNHVGEEKAYKVVYHKIHNGNLKQTILSRYGGQCAICGVTDPAFLNIDHIDGRGGEHRRSIGVSGAAFYEWLINNDFPPGFQVLCWNHNWLKYLETVRLSLSDSGANHRVRKSNNKLKMLVISHYGGRCACCGETNVDVLTIDHINGGGKKHRKELGFHSSLEFYRWLRDNSLPSGFQVLCFNHNCGKAIGWCLGAKK